MGALLPEGNGKDHSGQNDLGPVYRTCCDFYKNGYLLHLCSWTHEEYILFLPLILYIKVLGKYISISKEHFLKYKNIPSAEGHKNNELL